MVISDADMDRLFAAAKSARGSAYAPYSLFRVGSALLFECGEIVSGCNVENGSYGLSLCAERNAMTAAVLRGLRSPVAIAIAGEDGKLCSPCGACRQFLSEFNPDMYVIMEDRDGRTVYKLSDLLPLHFYFDKKGDIS